MRKCDMTLGKALIGLINGTNEPLKNDLIVTRSKLWQDKQILAGRQVVKMILDYFKTHRDLQQKYTYEDLNAIQWKGDQHIGDTYNLWNLIMGNMNFDMPEGAKIEHFMRISVTLRRLPRTSTSLIATRVTMTGAS